MPTEIVAIIDKPWLLAVLLAVGAVCGIAVERFVESLKRAERAAYWKGRNSVQGARGGKPIAQGNSERRDVAAGHLKTVMGASFTSRPLLNKPERRLLSVLDKALEEESPGWRTHGQVCLGEFLWSDDKKAFWAINAKRVDLLIVDDECKPLHAVEFQGTGHYMGDEAAARDAVKKEALRRAGIGYVEVVSGDTPSEVRSMVRKLVRQLQST